MPQLFRQEAIDAQREKFLGEATIARPVPFWVFTALAAGTAVLLISVAVWGQYTRRERVEGYLALDTGAARVLIPDSGRITDLRQLLTTAEPLGPAVDGDRARLGSVVTVPLARDDDRNSEGSA